MSIIRFVKSRSLLAWITLVLGSIVLFEIVSVALHSPSSGLASISYSRPWLFPLMVALGLILVGITELFTKKEYRPVTTFFSLSVSGGAFPFSVFIMLLYAATFEPLGFVVSSSIAMLMLAIVGHRRLRATPLLLAIFLPATLYFFMVHFLGVYLPDGVID